MKFYLIWSNKIDIWFYLDQLVYVFFFCYCIIHCSITDTTSAAIDLIEHSAQIVRHLWWMHTIHCNKLHHFEIHLILHFQHWFWLAFSGMANMENEVKLRIQAQLKGCLIAIKWNWILNAVELYVLDCEIMIKMQLVKQCREHHTTSTVQQIIWISAQWR